MKVTRKPDGRLSYRYTTFGGEMSFNFSLLSEVGEPYQLAAVAQLDTLRARGFVITTRELDAKPWVADFALKPKEQP